MSNKCVDCNKDISQYAKRCKSCSRKKEKNPAYKHGLKIRDEKKRKYKFCIDCGDKIDYTAIRCIKCSNKHRNGEKSSTWNGGVDAEGYIRSAFSNELKEKIRERDNYTCQECGKIHGGHGKKFDVHHIDYDKTNNIPSNLITLCNKCHTKTSIIDKEFWYLHFINKININNHWLRVTWEDACNYSNEGDKDIIEKEPELVDTFGKIAFYDKKYCIIITHDSRAESNDYIRIPISLLRKITI